MILLPAPTFAALRPIRIPALPLPRHEQTTLLPPARKAAA